jgi:two-component system, response regulator
MTQFNLVDTLIVEDNPHDAELIIRILKKKNLVNQFYIAEDGEEALDFVFCRGKFSNRNPLKLLKVIFLDLKLPKVNGLEVLKELKSNVRTKKIPVVIITSSKEDRDIKTAFELGANSYVVKPVEFDQFLQSITNTGFYWLMINEPPK